MEHTEMTVGDLIDLLSACDRSAPVRLAMNPFFPMAHQLTQVVQADEEKGQRVPVPAVPGALSIEEAGEIVKPGAPASGGL